MKRKLYIAGASALLLAAVLNPWTYDHRGFADATLPIAGGELILSLDDQASRRKTDAYCLSSLFRTSDAPGERIVVRLDQIGTTSLPSLRTAIEHTGNTTDLGGFRGAYFEAPSGEAAFAELERLAGSR
jgi:hypothetical protein